VNKENKEQAVQVATDLDDFIYRISITFLNLYQRRLLNVIENIVISYSYKPDKMKKKIIIPVLVFLITILLVRVCPAQGVDDLKLRDYRPKSIYKVPVTNIARAKYPAIDMHTHVYGRNDNEIARWIKAMDACGIEKAIVFTGATGERFDTLMKLYSKYGDRFE